MREPRIPIHSTTGGQDRWYVIGKDGKEYDFIPRDNGRMLMVAFLVLLAAGLFLGAWSASGGCR